MPRDTIKIDLEELREIMEEIGEVEVVDGFPDRRKHTLTHDDVLVIAKIVQAVSHKSCAMGLTADEISTLKSAIRTMNKGILVVGYAILGAIGAGFVSVTWWAIKHGIIEVSQSAGKVAGK